MITASTTASTTAVRTAAAPRTPWRRARVWVVLALVLLATGALVAAFTSSPSRPLDPGSAAPDGSRALARVLARVLAGYGGTVHATSSVADAARGVRGTAVLVTAPDDYSDAQLRRLRDGATRLVLVRPGTRAAAAVAPDVEPQPDEDATGAPGCPDAGARAAGPVSLPSDTVPYSAGAGFTRCYGGALVTSARVAVLGSAQLLQNRRLGDTGVAALDVNALTGNGALGSLVWLSAGPDAAGAGAASIGDLFPAGVWRALWWLLAVAVLLALWRGRRLGGVVLEPLPVVVRAAEVVEGHGRLYHRAGARDRAGAALRTASAERLRATLGLPRTADTGQVATAAARLTTRSAGDVHDVLAGAIPVDDAGLTALAVRLDELEAAVHAAATQGSNRRERAW